MISVTGVYLFGKQIVIAAKKSRVDLGRLNLFVFFFFVVLLKRLFGSLCVFFGCFFVVIEEHK